MDARATLGIDVGGTTTKAALVDRDGSILERSERPTDPSAATKGVIAVVDDLLQRATEIGVEVVAVGVGAAGFVSGDTVIFSPNLVYDDPSLEAAVRARSGVPAVIENDANVAAWGERSFGTARGIDDLALITLGTGIGSGFVVEGRLLRGYSGSAGELGHTVVDPTGPPCGCGLRGCLEQFASGEAIARMGREAAQQDPDTTMIAFAGAIDQIQGEHVAKAAREYDESARAVLRKAGRALAIGLSNVANLFDPELIVLAGGVTRAGEPFLGPARDELARMTSEQKRRPMRLDVSTLSGDAGILGASALAWERER